MLDKAYWEKKVKPFPEHFVEVKFHQVFNRDQVAKLETGLIPQSMDDKWFIVLHTANLDFYRSWTGYHIYRLKVTRHATGIEVDSLQINDDPTQYRRSTVEDDQDLIKELLAQVLQQEIA